MSNEEGETREITAVDHINKDSMGKLNSGTLKYKLFCMYS